MKTRLHPKPPVAVTGFTMRKALASWSLILFGLLAERGFLTLTLILVARRTNVTEYGQYISVYGLLSLLSVFTNLGIDAWVFSRGNLDLGRVKGLWHSTFRIRLGLTVLWIVLSALLIALLSPQTFPPRLYLITLLGVAADSLAMLAYFSFRSLGQNRIVAFVQGGSALLLFALTFWLFLQPAQITEFALLRTAISVATALGIFLATSQKFRSPAVELLPAREVIRSAFPFLWSELATSLYLRADLSIIALFLGSAGAANYGPALNITNMTFLVPSALYFLVLPRLSRARTAGRKPFLHIASRQLLAQLLVGVLLAVGTYFVAGPLVTGIFGPQYLPSVRTLQMLGLVIFLKPLNFGLAAILISMEKQKPRAQVQAAAALFNLLGNILLVMPLGVAGVAAIYNLSELLLFLGYSKVLSGQLRSEEPA